MEDCIFCKIAKGEIPAVIVSEDKLFMAIMDISPISKGHIQIIPKGHYRWTWDVPEFGKYWEFARKVAIAQMKGLSAKMVEFLTHGMEVEHAHIWVVPIYNNEAFIKADERLTITKEQLIEISDKIKKEI